MGDPLLAHSRPEVPGPPKIVLPQFRRPLTLTSFHFLRPCGEKLHPVFFIIQPSSGSPPEAGLNATMGYVLPWGKQSG